VGRERLTKHPKTSARRVVGDALEYEYDDGSGVLTVKYRDTDPSFATRAVNRAVEILQEEFRGLTLRRVTEKRADLEKRVSDAETELNDSKQALIDFSVEHGIVDINAQASSAASQVAQLSAQLTAKELERNNLLKSGRSAQDPQVRQLQSDIDELNRLLGELRSGFRTYTAVTIPETQLPRIVSEYVDLKYEVTLRQTVYGTLRQSLEAVLLEEKDETSAFQVISRAEVPEVRSSPNRALIAVLGAFAAFFLSLFIAFLMEYVSRLERDPAEASKLTEIRRHLRFRKR